jgi:hypothetical protein
VQSDLGAGEHAPASATVEIPPSDRLRVVDPLPRLCHLLYISIKAR